MQLLQIHKFSTASKVFLLAMVILLGGLFFTVNTALQQQKTSSNASAGNYITNPGCESGTSGFSGYQASISTVSSPVHSGNASCKVVSSGGSFYDITATNSYPNPQQGQTFSGYAYVRANSNTGGKVYVALQEWNGSSLIKSTYGNPVYLSTTWQLVTNTTTMSSNGTRLVYYVVQDPGSSGQVFYADDMYFSSGNFSSPITPPANTAPTALPVVQSGNVLINPSFENGTTGWLLYNTSPGHGSFTTTNTTASDGNNSAQLTITSSSSDDWDVQLYQEGLSIISGQTYTVTFWAKASANRQISSAIQQNASPYIAYAGNDFNLTTSWQEYSYTFTANTTQPNLIIEFNVAKNTGQVWIDNVSYATGTFTPPTATPAPTAIYAPTSTPAPTATPTPTEVPAPSISPYVSSTTIPSSIPTSTPSSAPSILPTAIYLPTSTPVPGDTTIFVNLGLQGIGTSGDSSNPNSDGNMNPLHPQRTITVDVYNAQNQQVAVQTGTVTYSTSTGKFGGNIDLGTLATGLYTIKIQSPQYLRGLVPGIQSVTQGQVTNLPYLSLVVGDLNGDNQINIIDYNILMGCYSDLLPAISCTSAQKAVADINDDGNVNEFDYNLFLRELSNVGGQ